MCLSFEDKCAKTRTFPIYHGFIMRGNHVRVQGHKKNLPHITFIFHVFKYVVKIYFSISHFTSHFFAKTLT